MLGLAYMVTAGMFAPRPKYSAKQLRKKYTVPDSLKGLFPIVDSGNSCVQSLIL
jgi:hypothetical protein